MSDGEITEWPITKPEDGQGGTKDGITDIACDSGDPSGMADRDPAFFYYDRRKRSGMDCHCDCADMHSEDPEMRSDHDNRHGNHLSCGKFVPEKCDRETPSLCCGPRCDAENSVPFGIFLPFGTHFQRFCRSGDHFQLLS